MPYLKATDNGAVDGMSKMEMRSWMPSLKRTKECPICLGYGGWHLTLNAYGPGKHFNCMCSHCNGTGFVLESETCAPHTWTLTENLGRCYNRYTCTGCGLVTDIDSSD